MGRLTGAEAAKLKKFSDAGGAQTERLSDVYKNQLLSSFYKIYTNMFGYYRITANNSQFMSK